MTSQIDLSVYQPDLSNTKHHNFDVWAEFNAAAQKRKEVEQQLKQSKNSQLTADEQRRAAIEKCKLDDVLFTAEYQNKNKLTWLDLEKQINDEDEYCREAESDCEDGNSVGSDTAVETDAETEMEMQDEYEASVNVVEKDSHSESSDTQSSDADCMDSNGTDDEEDVRDTSSVYEEINDNSYNNNKLEKENYHDDPLDYVTDTFEIKNINKRVEDVIDIYHKKNMRRRGLAYRTEIEDALIKYDKGKLDPELVRQLKKHVAFQNRPSSADLLHYEKIRKRRSARKIKFGQTRVITYNVGEVVTKGEHPKKPIHGAPGKSIMRNTKVEKFETPNHDFSIVGMDELLNAIGRLFNMCDIPLMFFNNTDPIASLNVASVAVGNALAAKELCGRHLMKEKLESKNKALKQRNKTIDELQTENSLLVSEVSELKEKLEQVTAEMNLKAQESRNNLDVANDRTRELKQTVGDMEELKIDLIETRSKVDALTAENNDLRDSNRELKANLLQQKEYSKPLHAQIRNLERKLVQEQKHLSDSWEKIQSLEQYSKDSLKLQSRLQAAVKSNDLLVKDNGKLRVLSGELSNKVKTVEISLQTIGKTLEASRSNESRLQTANQKLAKERDECHEKIDKLEDTNHAYKAEFGLQFRQLEAKYAEAVKHCRIREKEIRRAERQLEKMGQCLRDTEQKMVKRRDDNTVHVYSENMAEGEDCFDKRRLGINSDLPVSGKHGHRVFRSLSNKMHAHMSPSDYKLGPY